MTRLQVATSVERGEAPAGHCPVCGCYSREYMRLSDGVALRRCV